MKRISFLIAAHNEEKIIGKALDNLISLPYENYEVLIGLDGCTDKTEEIVKKFCENSEKFKYLKLNLRRGKPEVIDEIIKKSTGEIIVIHDADWLFFVKDKEKLEKMVSVFDVENIGGIADSFPIEWEETNPARGNIGYKAVAKGSYFWFKFQKKSFTHKSGNLTYLKNPKMFLTNIFRKELYKKNNTLGDDFERTKDIMDKGFKIILFEDVNMPRMKAIYDKIEVKDLFKQKVRTSIARKQLKETSKIENLQEYYASSARYILINSWKKGLNVGCLATLWLVITLLGEVVAKIRFGGTSTREGWKIRAKRQT